MQTVQRVLTTLAASALLVVGGAALAAPVHADSHVSVLNLVGETSNGSIDLTGPGGGTILQLPNFVRI
jgi:hypothetical protein